MKNILYLIFYHPAINSTVRSALKLFFPHPENKFSIPSSGKIAIKTVSEPAFRMMKNQRNYRTKSIYWEGYEKFEDSPIFEKIVSDMEIFLDAGANIGYYFLQTATVNKDICMIGFESASGPLHYYRKNVVINGVTESKSFGSLCPIIRARLYFTNKE